MRYIHDSTTARLNKMFDGNTLPKREMIEGEQRVVEIVVKFGSSLSFIYPHSDMEFLGFLLDDYAAYKLNNAIMGVTP